MCSGSGSPTTTRPTRSTAARGGRGHRGRHAGRGAERRLTRVSDRGSRGIAPGRGRRRRGSSGSTTPPPMRRSLTSSWSRSSAAMPSGPTRSRRGSASRHRRDLAALLAAEPLDALSVCTPTALHRPVVEARGRGGRPRPAREADGDDGRRLRRDRPGVPGGRRRADARVHPPVPPRTHRGAPADRGRRDRSAGPRPGRLHLRRARAVARLVLRPRPGRRRRAHARRGPHGRPAGLAPRQPGRRGLWPDDVVCAGSAPASKTAGWRPSRSPAGRSARSS